MKDGNRNYVVYTENAKRILSKVYHRTMGLQQSQQCVPVAAAVNLPGFNTVNNATFSSSEKLLAMRVKLSNASFRSSFVK